MSPLITEPLEAVQTEYTRLFISAFPSLLCPPYESFYRDGQLYGQAIDELAALYEKAGLAYSCETQPLDYLPTELEFYALTGEDAMLQRLREWVPQFAEQVTEHSPLYGPCAQELVRSLRYQFPMLLGESGQTVR